MHLKSAALIGALTAALMLSACVPAVVTPPVPHPPPVPVGAADTCDATPLAYLVGQPATALERVLVMRPIRLIRPGTAVTEDFSAARLNIHIDAGETVTGLTCG